MKFFAAYILPVFIWMAVIFYFSSLSSVGISLEFDRGGISLHFLEYIILGFLSQRAFANSCLNYKWVSILFFSVATGIIYGATDELHQSLVPNRSPSLADLAADSLGALAGSALYLARIKLGK